MQPELTKLGAYLDRLRKLRSLTVFLAGPHGPHGFAITLETATRMKLRGFAHDGAPAFEAALGLEPVDDTPAIRAYAVAARMWHEAFPDGTWNGLDPRTLTLAPRATERALSDWWEADEDRIGWPPYWPRYEHLVGVLDESMA